MRHMHLALNNVHITFPGRDQPVVHRVSLPLAAGELGVLMGPSGCGKTTLIRAVAGLERVSAGEIHIGGELVSSTSTHLAPQQRRVGMVFQDYALFPHLSVAQNIAFGIDAWAPRARAQRVQEVLELVRLGDLAQRMPHELSGGQQQRVAVARALAPKPQLLLLDEPFSNLDTDLRERLAGDLRAILKTANATALFVTHDQLEAFAVGDRVGVMNQGELHQWDAPYELYHNPRTKFVASFTGQGVFVDVGTAAQADHLLGGLRDQVFNDTNGAVPSDGISLLLRADDIVHDDDAPTKACIEHKVFRGSTFLYTLRLASGQQVKALVPSHHNHHIGEWIGVRAEVEHLVGFGR
jgi:iron(III) transport system ATP-binding protein